MNIYLDNNSTTPMLPEVSAAMGECAREFLGNPASQHAAGRAARRRLEAAREAIAQILGAQTSGMKADRLVFTSGGTEANNLALLGLVPGRPCLPGTTAGPVTERAARQADPTHSRVVISAIEHPSVVGAAEELVRRGHAVRRLRVTADGVVDLAHLDALLAEPPHLASVMLGNNETGVLQPIAEIARRCTQAGTLLHTDAVQAIGKLPVDFRALGAAAMTVAAHKLHGPRGIGALVVRSDVELHPILFGGFQQAALRPGTESVELAVGMQTALERWQAEGELRTRRLAELRDRFEHELTAALPNIVINGVAAPRLPHTSNLAFLGLDRQALVMALDLAGICCSTGSACASGSSEPSPVLLAMGCAEDAVAGSLRFSFGTLNTPADVAEASFRISKIVNDLRARKESGKIGPTARQQTPKEV